MQEDDRIRVSSGPDAGRLGTIVSGTIGDPHSWFVWLDGDPQGDHYKFGEGELTPLPTSPTIEALVAAARAAGAEGIWLLRGAGAAALEWTDAIGSAAGWTQLDIEPPHELIVLVRIPTGDGGEAGVEFRQ